MADLARLEKHRMLAAGKNIFYFRGELWGMQRRMNDCYRQQRFPPATPGC